MMFDIASAWATDKQLHITANHLQLCSGFLHVLSNTIQGLLFQEFKKFKAFDTKSINNHKTFQLVRSSYKSCCRLPSMFNLLTSEVSLAQANSKLCKDFINTSAEPVGYWNLTWCKLFQTNEKFVWRPNNWLNLECLFSNCNVYILTAVIGANRKLTSW